MNFDAIINGIHAQVREEARKKSDEAGQVSLGELAATLRGANGDAVVQFDDGTYPSQFDSYRGFYDQIAISSDDQPISVADVLARTEDAIGKTFTGYKGGEFTMHKSTPIWVSEYGGVSGNGIVSIVVTDDVVVLVVKEIPY